MGGFHGMHEKSGQLRLRISFTYKNVLKHPGGGSTHTMVEGEIVSVVKEKSFE